ncbi:MAG: hypothetical protein FAZ92_03153 [Accumulibacter sp.]|nr:MAG: hypothetical protein FAZ92_03153 [Accumulibacter sp.]
MHMADALISPLVGGVMWGVTAAVTACSARKIKAGTDDGVVPLMGVLGAFIFAAQMIISASRAPARAATSAAA